jgi:hypothetical protein
MTAVVGKAPPFMLFFFNQNSVFLTRGRRRGGSGSGDRSGGTWTVHTGCITCIVLVCRCQCWTIGAEDVDWSRRTLLPLPQDTKGEDGFKGSVDSVRQWRIFPADTIPEARKVLHHIVGKVDHRQLCCT